MGIGQFNAGKEALWLKKFLHDIIDNRTTRRRQRQNPSHNFRRQSSGNINHSFKFEGPCFPQQIKTHGYQIPLAARTGWEKWSQIRINYVPNKYVPSSKNITDILTKALPNDQFIQLRNHIMFNKEDPGFSKVLKPYSITDDTRYKSSVKFHMKLLR
jgi:hypothetical protein